jgi:hypothetical protein
MTDQPIVREPVNDPAAVALAELEERVIGFDGFGTPLYAHQVPPQGTE